MRVSELIQDLLLADPSAEVLLASDAEGNDYRQIAEDPYDPAHIEEDGDVRFVATSEEWDTPPNAIVLWPV